MIHCMACRAELPDDAEYCGFCGFRQVPILEAEHLRKATVTPPFFLVADASKAIDQNPKGKNPGSGSERSSFALMDTAPHLRASEEGEAGAAPKLPRIVLTDDGKEILALEDTLPNLQKDPEHAFANGSALPSKEIVRSEETISEIMAPMPPPSENGSTPPSLAESFTPRPQRYPIKVEITFESEHNFYKGETENISSGGIFISTSQPAPIGKMLEVIFTIPGLKRPCIAVCQVRWARQLNPQMPEIPSGMGLRFIRLDSSSRAAIDLFIQHRQPIFYEDD